MRKISNNNGGYSLVELIIVIAIIAIMSGLAGVTLSSIKTAKATDAKESFDEQLSALQMRTKTQNKDFAIEIVRDADEKCYNIFYGKMKNDGSFIADNTEADVVLNRAVIYFAAKQEDAGEELSSVVIQFNKSDGSVKQGSGVYKFYKEGTKNSVGQITLNKAGSHYSGK